MKIFIYITLLWLMSNNLLADCLPIVDLKIFDPDKIKLPVEIISKLNLTKNLQPFYSKANEASGILIISSHNVSDEAHQRASDIITKMIGHNPTIQKRLIDQNSKLAIFADNEKISDLPEMSFLKNAKTFDGRSHDDTCGTGGVFGISITTICEKNLLKKKNDPYFGRDLHQYLFLKLMKI